MGVVEVDLPSKRLDALFDGWTLLERADGVVVGRGVANGVEAIAFVTDAGTQGGALGRDGCRAIVSAVECAVAAGIAVVGVWHSGGARLAEGIDSLDGMARVFAAKSQASGHVPQLSLILGPSAGGAAYGPALTDIVVLGPAGRVFVTGPGVVRKVTGEDVDMERLGGAETHSRSGVAHLVCDTDEEATTLIRELLALICNPGRAALDPNEPPDPGKLLPDSARRAYDIRPVARALLDAGALWEFQEGWARNVVIGLGRLGGQTVGVVATNPLRLAGCLDAASGDKAARFVQWCDALGIALLFLVDVPGYLPGVGQEDAGVIRRGAKLLHAYATAQVPRMTVLVRKAYGGAYIAMGSRGLGADLVLAWPDSRVGVMGPDAAAEVLHRHELAEIADDDRRAERLQVLAKEYEQSAGGVDSAVDSGTIDRVVEPLATRAHLIAALRRAGQPQGNDHRNPPL